jgi:hypothetical protein
MRQQFVQHYRGYELLCRPMALPDGRYQPTLLIAKEADRTRHEEPVALQESHLCACESHAAAHAFKEGMRWVDSISDALSEPDGNP